MKRLTFALFILFFSALAYAGVYSWVDENGVRHFSDTGAPEDKTVEVEESGELENGEAASSKSGRGKKNRAATPGYDREIAKEKARDEAEEKAREKAEERENRKLRRESMAEEFFFMAENAEAEEGYGPEKAALFFRRLGETCLKCSGGDIDKAEAYYHQAEAKIDELLIECEAKVKKGSLTYTKVTFGEKEWSKGCVKNKVREAKSLKDAGDAYMCP